MHLPVQADRSRVVPLQPVHAQVALPGHRVPGVRESQVEEYSTVLRPRCDARQPAEVDVRAVQHPVLAGRRAHPPRWDRAKLHDLSQRLPQASGADRQFRPQQRGDPVADAIEPVHAERERHPALGPEDVDRQWHRTAPRPLEQQRRAARPHHPLDDLADLQMGIDRHPDPAQLAVPLQPGEEVTQIVIRHRASIRPASRPVARRG